MRPPISPAQRRFSKTVVRGERIKAREVTKFPARYRKAITVPLPDLGRYHWNTNLQRIVDDGVLAAGDADLSTEVRTRGSHRCERETGTVTT